MRISISICPSSLDISGDLLCQNAVEKAYKKACNKFAPDAKVDFEIAYRFRGHDEFVVDGRGHYHDKNYDEDYFAAHELHSNVIEEIDWADESLYQKEFDND
jgi:hypothetical protein